MMNRTVPQVSRRPTKVAMTPGSHVVSDIGYVTIPDRNGNKYWVLYKDLCSQHREVYRMKRKDDIVGVWCQYIADNEFQDLQCTLVCRIRNFITDADASYIEGKVKEVNKNKLIRKWTIAPYTQCANPAESEMQRMMEHAVSMLYNSGLPPSFLLDALDCHTQIVNRLFTPVYHRECDKYKTPYERFHGTKPSFNDMARFGCKTITFVWRDYRAKHDAHSWVDWYFG